MKEVRIADLNDIEKLAPTILELRPHLNVDALHQKLPALFKEGFTLIYIGDDKEAYAIAGFRVLNFLYSGKTLYVDDLATHSAHRKKGYADQLLNWMKDYARKKNCDHFSLDSGVQRKDAHRLYLNAKLEIEGFHFARKMIEL